MRGGFSQRARRQHPAVAFASVDEHVDVACEAAVLEAVIEEQEVRAARDGLPGERHAIGADPYRHARAATCDEARLVADLFDRPECGGGDVEFFAARAAVAARQHRHAIAATHGLVREVDDDRGLACSADDQVADGDDLRARDAGGLPQAGVEGEVPAAHDERPGG